MRRMAVPQDVECPHDGRQRCSDLVRNHGDEVGTDLIQLLKFLVYSRISNGVSGLHRKQHQILFVLVGERAVRAVDYDKEPNDATVDLQACNERSPRIHEPDQRIARPLV